MNRKSEARITIPSCIASSLMERSTVKVGTGTISSSKPTYRLSLAFTDRQLSLLLRFTNRPPPVIQPAFPPGLAPPIIHNRHIPPISFPPNLVPQRWHQGPMMERGPFVTVDACERVAQDFGLDSALVHALAERLVLHSSTIVPTARQY